MLERGDLICLQSLEKCWPVYNVCGRLTWVGVATSCSHALECTKQIKQASGLFDVIIRWRTIGSYTERQAEVHQQSFGFADQDHRGKSVTKSVVKTRIR